MQFFLSFHGFNFRMCMCGCVKCWILKLSKYSIKMLFVVSICWSAWSVVVFCFWTERMKCRRSIFRVLFLQCVQCLCDVSRLSQLNDPWSHRQVIDPSQTISFFPIHVSKLNQPNIAPINEFISLISFNFKLKQKHSVQWFCNGEPWTKANQKTYSVFVCSGHELDWSAPGADENKKNAVFTSLRKVDHYNELSHDNVALLTS